MSSESRPAVADGKRSREEKRKRWEAKQETKRNVRRKEEQRETWFRENAHFATLVSQKDVDSLLSGNVSTSEPVDDEDSSSKIASMLRPYMNLQDGGPKMQTTGQADDDTDATARLFIAEGTETVRLLIQQCKTQSTLEGTKNLYGVIQIKSIFTKPSVLFDAPVHLLEDVERASSCCRDEAVTPDDKPKNDGNSNGTKKTPPPFHVLVANEKTISSVAGFSTSRGAMACGVVPSHHTEQWLLHDYLPQLHAQRGGSLRLLALDGISDTANLGSMVRCASAFGVDAILLSSECCDAWYRRAVRVSMGHVFRVPCVRVANLATMIEQLGISGDPKMDSGPPLQVTSYAAVIDRDADLVLEQVERGVVPNSWCCVMGNESTGISPPVVKACTKTIRIDMTTDVDSLSVPIATGILLHGLKERERKMC